MKTIQKRAPEFRKISAKLEEKIGKENKDALMASFGAVAQIMADGFQDLFIKEGIQLPANILYAVIQTYNLLDVMQKTCHDEILKGKIHIDQIDVYDVHNDKDAEKRLIFMVKHFYEDLQKRGKL